MFASERLTEAVARAHQHWIARQENGEEVNTGRPARFSIAISREAGTYGAAVAREIGKRLGWPVYDRELLQCIADDIGVHRTLLESVDERQQSWLGECLSSLFNVPEVNQTVYFRRLVETLLSLASHGDCVIVGRGATNILPQVTTLRVRMVAPLEHRIEGVRREHSISRAEAVQRVEATDRERNQFVSAHFHVDPADPANYDLVLNTARLSTVECADLILAALDHVRRRAGAEVPLEPAHA